MTEIKQAPRPTMPTPPHVRDARNRRRMKNLLLNMSYQLRFTVVIVGISAALMTGLGALLYRFIRDASRIVGVRAMDPTDLEAIALQKQFLHYDHLLLLALIASGLILIAAMAAFGIILTHRVAGPLYRISAHLAAIRDGHMRPLGSLRQHDQLVDFYANFCDAQQYLEVHTRQELKLLEEAINQIEVEMASNPKPALSEAQVRLYELKKVKERFLP